MCAEAVRKKSCLLQEIPDHLKPQEMSAKEVHKEPCLLQEIQDHDAQMCAKVVHNESYLLGFVPDHLTTQKMCIKRVKEGPENLVVVADLFVTRKLVKIWHDDEDCCNNDGLAVS